MEDFGSFAIGCFWLAAVAGCGWIALHYLIKWFRKDDDTSGGEFTIGDLRRLVRDGKMTPEEFEKAKTIIVGRSVAAINRPGGAAKAQNLPADAAAMPNPPVGSADSRIRGFSPIVSPPEPPQTNAAASQTKPPAPQAKPPGPQAKPPGRQSNAPTPLASNPRRPGGQ